MKGLDLNLFLADARVKLVLGLVVIAVLIAIILTYLELKIKKRKEIVVARSAEDKFVTEFLTTMNSLQSTEEKLNFLDKTAKKFLNENFKTNIRSDYSILAKQLKKQRGIEFFCREMFDAHYSSEINEKKINELSEIFIEIFKSAQEKKTKPQKPSLIDKLEPLFFESEKEKRNKKYFVGKILFVKDFLTEKLAKVTEKLARRKENLSVDWSENFKDVNKELLLKNATFSGVNNLELQRALLSKQKEIAQKKLENISRKKIKKRKRK